MAELEESAAEKSGSAFGFLGHKIAGKVPVWVVAVAAIGGYYWYTRYGPGKKTTASSAAQTTGTDPAGNTGVIDPATGYVYGSSEDSAALAAAGNTGPDNGGYYGGGGSSSGGTIATPVITGNINRGGGEGGPPPPPIKPFIPGVGHIGEGTVPGVRKPPAGTPPRRPPTFLPASASTKNEEWGGLAVSNLISQGVPPDQASTAIQAHLNGQPLAPAMAANRDLAIESIGPPPAVPAPSHVGGNSG